MIINRACGKLRAGTLSAVDVRYEDFYISTEGRMETERAMQANLRQKLGGLTRDTPFPWWPQLLHYFVFYLSHVSITRTDNHTIQHVFHII